MDELDRDQAPNWWSKEVKDSATGDCLSDLASLGAIDDSMILKD